MGKPVAGELLLFVAVSGLLFTLSEPLRSADARDEEVVVKGMFVFGSSLVDNGNNNYLKNSSAKADYSPYGIDFPLGPSGRFSNGRNSIDALGELLRFPGFIPPFADPRTAGGRILHGVDFASGGSGILDQTGALARRSLSLAVWPMACRGVERKPPHGTCSAGQRKNAWFGPFHAGHSQLEEKFLDQERGR
ncbi:GDSL esterase/lipase [Platanthera zijinensis]|uniref:GDSL esterase/lipase n=1 Tax=Platanthera zijinensis TaxID=2320716 RepID=A0AAP0AS11_9ASPA